MITFSLLFLFPCGWNSGNQEIACVRALYLSEAIEAFRLRVPTLSDFGYAKQGDFSWVVAQPA